MSANSSWMQRDLAVLWHPCTQMKDHESLPLIPIRRGAGVWMVVVSCEAGALRG